MKSITIVSDDVEGIESLIMQSNSISKLPGIKGVGIETIHKIKEIFGSNTKLSEIMQAFKDDPELAKNLNGQLEVYHGLA